MSLVDIASSSLSTIRVGLHAALTWCGVASFVALGSPFSVSHSVLTASASVGALLLWLCCCWCVCGGHGMGQGMRRGMRQGTGAKDPHSNETSPTDIECGRSAGARDAHARASSSTASSVGGYTCLNDEACDDDDVATSASGERDGSRIAVLAVARPSCCEKAYNCVAWLMGWRRTAVRLQLRHPMAEWRRRAKDEGRLRKALRMATAFLIEGNETSNTVIPSSLNATLLTMGLSCLSQRDLL